MKLSDVKGEACLDVLADITGPIIALAQDEDVKALFSGKGCPEGEDRCQYATEQVKKGLPKLVKSHKADFIQILAALDCKAPEDYAKELTLAKLMADIVELLTDEDFGSFFD